MTLYFVTGNKNKLREIQEVFKDFKEIKQLDIDLPELQDIDPKEIIKAKLKEALKHKQKRLIVEDTSLYLEALNGLPGPLIKWFMKTIGNQGIYELTSKLGNNNAEAKTIIGYAENPETIRFFEGTIRGTIVCPESDSDFGWDPIFRPIGHTKSFAEMTKQEKNEISMRKIALNQLKEYLQNKK